MAADKIKKNSDGTTTLFKKKDGRLVYNGKVAKPQTGDELRKPAKPAVGVNQPSTETPTTTVIPEGIRMVNPPKGEEAPVLSVDAGKMGRLYAKHPDYKTLVETNPAKALKEGVAFPSITNVQGYAGGPSQEIENWRKRTAGNEAERQLNDLIKKAAKETSTREEVLYLMSQLADTIKEDVQESADRHTEEAADRGSRVHAVVELLVRGENPKVDETIRGYVNAYYKFREDFPHLEFVGAEMTVLNEKEKYMGTADGLVRDTRTGELYTLDWKTNKRGHVYTKVGQQLAAIANAEWIVHPDGTKEPMPEVKGGLGIGLSRRGTYEVRLFDDITNPENVWYEQFKTGVTTWYSSNVDAENAPSRLLQSSNDL